MVYQIELLTYLQIKDNTVINFENKPQNPLTVLMNKSSWLINTVYVHNQLK